MTAVLEAEAILNGLFPEEFWDVNDDACDCTFQRIGMWTNPYLGETLEVRMCCIWAELYKLFPDKVRVTKGYMNYNENRWDEGVREWDGESDMPPSIWYRHLARLQGRTVADIREEYRYKDHLRPKGTPRPVAVSEPQVDMVQVFMSLVGDLALKVHALEDRLNGVTE